MCYLTLFSHTMQAKYIDIIDDSLSLTIYFDILLMSFLLPEILGLVFVQNGSFKSLFVGNIVAI